MHRITDNKVSGTAQRYLEVFRCLCGDSVLSNAIRLTTMWSELRGKAVSFKRQRELRERFWKTMESKGSEIRSFDGSRAIAEGFVCRLMRKKKRSLVNPKGANGRRKTTIRDKNRPPHFS